MAMEIHVFFRGALPQKRALSRALKDLGFPLALSPATGPLEGHSGFLPMRLEREQSGVEFDVFDGRAEIDEVAPGLEVDPAFDRSANFRWGGDESEMLCALYASAALARLVNGVFLGEDEPRVLDADEAIAAARRYLADTAAKPKGRSSPGGTRPADLKRYLKPLLEQRSDLVLVERHLVIRPVRHLLRGVFFDRTSDKYVFNIRRHAVPLYASSGQFGIDRSSGVIGYGDDRFGRTCDVWQPHFQALLFDSLAEEAFPRIGSIRTLADFADMAAGDEGRPLDATAVKALVLAGEPERAAAYIDRMEQQAPRHPARKSWAEEQRALLAHDIADICAKAHAEEAETVKAMKLEAVWEPSPFPAELQPHERAARSDESPFVPAPWIRTPPWLLQELPMEAADVRFAKDDMRRDGRRLLIVPLSRDEAERRHRDREPYLLFVRLADGVLVRLSCSGLDRNEPGYSGPPVGSPILSLDLDGADHHVDAKFWGLDRDDPLLHLQWANVRNRETNATLWDCGMQRMDDEVEITDRRNPTRVAQDRVLTAADHNIITGPPPEFGDYESVVNRVRAWLRHAGFGEIT